MLRCPDISEREKSSIVSYSYMYLKIDNSYSNDDPALFGRLYNSPDYILHLVNFKIKKQLPKS